LNILWVKPGKLLPLDSGGKLRSYNILRHLAAAHDVTCLSYYGGVRDEEYEQEIQQHLPGTVCVQHAATFRLKGLARYFDYARHLPARAPYSVSKFAVPNVRTMLEEWMARRRFDVAVCDFLASSLNFPRDLMIPTVLFQHNVEASLWRRRAQFETRRLDRWIARIEHAKMSRFERLQICRFHHVLTVSEEDRLAMAGMIDPGRISVIPTGVDLATYHYDPEARPAEPLVLFTGSMDWAPNIDGVEFFCREVWPQVLAQLPRARFRIVGRNPHTRVQKLASASVEVTGSVPSIVDHLREAAVLVVPLRIGGGTRIKIYEGMAMGKATVSTHLGAEGLEVQPGNDILLADDPGLFAEHVISLLRDEQMRNRYESAAARTAQKHDWSAVTRCFVEALHRTIMAASPEILDGEPIATNVR